MNFSLRNWGCEGVRGVSLVISAVITGQNGTLSQPKIYRYKLSLLPKAPL